jgi:hypothetical protein
VTQAAFTNAGRYLFVAFMKTAGITTDEGIRLHIFAEGPAVKLDVMTEPMGGTTPWTRIEKTFSVPGDINLVKVEVTRLPSLKFENQIAGDVWIDDVSLSRMK